MTLDVYTKALVFLALPAAVGFPLMYGTLQPWWRSMVGRALLTKSSAVGLLIVLAALVYLLGPDYAWREQVRACAFTLLVVGIWWQFLVFAPTIWRARRERRERHESVRSGTLDGT